MDVVVISGKAGRGFVERQFRQQRDAVEGFLPVGDHAIAERLDRLARKRFVDAFDLLQADDIGG